MAKQKERFDAITKQFFNELVYVLVTANDSEAQRQDGYSTANFYQIAENYLKNGGMTDDDVASLKQYSLKVTFNVNCFIQVYCYLTITFNFQ